MPLQKVIDSFYDSRVLHINLDIEHKAGRNAARLISIILDKSTIEIIIKSPGSEFQFLPCNSGWDILLDAGMVKGDQIHKGFEKLYQKKFFSEFHVFQSHKIRYDYETGTEMKIPTAGYSIVWNTTTLKKYFVINMKRKGVPNAI